jgi:hypothetical protein
MNLTLVRRVIDAEVRYVMDRSRDIEKAAASSAFPDAIAARELVRGGTLYENDVPIVIGGLTVLKRPYLVAWLIASKDLKPYVRIVLPEVKQALSAVSREHLILANVSDGVPSAERFVLKLGFIPSKRLPTSQNYILNRMQT